MRHRWPERKKRKCDPLLGSHLRDEDAAPETSGTGILILTLLSLLGGSLVLLLALLVLLLALLLGILALLLGVLALLLGVLALLLTLLLTLSLSLASVVAVIISIVAVVVCAVAAVVGTGTWWRLARRILQPLLGVISYQHPG